MKIATRLTILLIVLTVLVALTVGWFAVDASTHSLYSSLDQQINAVIRSGEGHPDAALSDALNVVQENSYNLTLDVVDPSGAVVQVNSPAFVALKKKPTLANVHATLSKVSAAVEPPGISCPVDLRRRWRLPPRRRLDERDRATGSTPGPRRRAHRLHRGPRHDGPRAPGHAQGPAHHGAPDRLRERGRARRRARRDPAERREPRRARTPGGARHDGRGTARAHRHRGAQCRGDATVRGRRVARTAHAVDGDQGLQRTADESVDQRRTARARRRTRPSRDRPHGPPGGRSLALGRGPRGAPAPQHPRRSQRPRRFARRGVHERPPGAFGDQ